MGHMYILITPVSIRHVCFCQSVMPTIVLGSGEQDGGQELMTGAGELAQGLRILVLAKNPSTHKLASNHL